MLQVTSGCASYSLKLDPHQVFSGEYFHLGADAGNGTDITENSTPCYCRGTLIRTEGGEVAVEDLAMGDRVVTVSGEAKPVKWIGRRGYAGPARR